MLVVLVFWNHDFAEIQYEPAGSDRDTTVAVDPVRGSVTGPAFVV